MDSSKRRRASVVDMLDEQIQRMYAKIEGEPRAQSSSGEIDAHNGREASRYEANQLLMSRLLHGFRREDGPIVCVKKRMVKGNGVRPLPIASWLYDLFETEPRLVLLDMDAPIEAVVSISPAVAVVDEEYVLPAKVPGYIRVRLRKFRFQMLVKI